MINSIDINNIIDSIYMYIYCICTYVFICTDLYKKNQLNNLN